MEFWPRSPGPTTEAIGPQTVEHFTGNVAGESIQRLQERRRLEQRLGALLKGPPQDLGTEVDYGEVVDHFNKIFIGQNGDGLIRRESWFPQPGLLERLMDRAGLAIFTGRLKYGA